MSIEAVKLARIEFEKDLEYDTNNEWDKRVVEGLKKAEKDLEVLEILKKHLIIRFSKGKNDAIILKDKFYDDYMYIIISKEEKDLLKEWLNNEHNTH